MNRAVVALGSNIDPYKNILKAKEILSLKFQVLAESCFQITKSIGARPQADFMNGAVLIQTELDRDQFKKTLKDIEAQLGRKRDHDHEAPRTIDLDITLWNDTIIDQDFYKRDYLKQSVSEILPNLKY